MGEGDEQIEEIEMIIRSTFGEARDCLTESDLERIMNTKVAVGRGCESR